MWLAKVKESYGDNLQVDWRGFFLAQINSKEGPEWKAWEQTEDSAALGLLAMRSGEAARRQGSQAFEAYQLALLKARHEDRKDLSNPDVIMEAAQVSGLDMDRFREDLADETILKDLGESHTEAVEEHGVFGVPTFIFPSGVACFLKTYQPPGEDAVEMFEEIYNVMGKWKYIGEVKRPQPPWPKGVFA
jgi:predicted DsbA family dithiol-disulfide isomerase